jgi:putative oxidoreductase
MTTLFLIGRVLFGGYFVYSSYGHLVDNKGAIGYAKAKGVPMANALVPFSGVLLFLGGASIITGYQVRLGFLALLVFLIPVTYMMHQFWKTTDPAHKMAEQIGFLKNCALIGAVLMMLAIPLMAFPALF